MKSRLVLDKRSGFPLKAGMGLGEQMLPKTKHLVDLDRFSAS